MKTSIAFIGGGNMATSLIGGLQASSCEIERILVAEPDENRRSELQQQYGIQTTGKNTETLACDVIVLAIKPQVLQSVCREISRTGDNNPLIISIAAGVRSTDIDRWLGGDQAIVRCMPNTPSLLQVGATAMFANEKVSAEQKILTEHILKSVGITLWVDHEKELDAVTAVSGSGPAYFFLLMEAMQKAGVALGLDAETAQQLTLQTALGAARMAIESDVDAATLRARVTSKGGTTEQAINSFEQSGFYQMVNNALEAAANRSETLANELGKDDS